MRIQVDRISEDLGEVSYHYDLFKFEADGSVLIARSYLDNPREAHFLRKEIGGELLPIAGSDVWLDSFREAASHLRQLGKTELTYLSPDHGGYVPLPK